MCMISCVYCLTMHDQINFHVHRDTRAHSFTSIFFKENKTRCKHLNIYTNINLNIFIFVFTYMFDLPPGQ